MIDAPPQNRRPDIQGLRAVAVLMVVGFHAGLPLPGGFVGVDVFFVISGFVITAMLHREWATSGRINFRQFYIRRFKRLTPALALMVSVTVLVSILLLSPFGAQQTTASTAIGAMLLVANLVIAKLTGVYFAAPAEMNPLLNTWSLSVEEQFYLVFPAILVLCWLISRRFRRLPSIPLLIVGGVAFASFSVAVLSSRGHFADWPMSTSLLGYYSPVTRAWEFAAGALLALSATKISIITRGTALLLSVMGVGMLGASLFVISEGTPFPGIWTLLPVVGTMLLLIAGTSGSNPVARALSTIPAVKLGDWSYSIYLWHWPLIVFAAVLWPGAPVAIFGAVALSLLVSILSYRWLEQPIRLYRPRNRGKLIGLVFATVVPPIALAAGLAFGAQSNWWTTWPSAVGPDEHVAAAECVDKPFDPASCRWGSGEAGSVLLVGDSQAYALADGVIDANSHLGLSTVVSSLSGCPFVEPGSTPGPGCAARQKEVLDWAIANRPKAVVIANRSSGYVNREWNWVQVLDPRTGSPATTTEEASKEWEAVLSGVVSPIREAGIGVVVVNPIADINDRADRRMLLRDVFHIGGNGTTIHSTTQQATDARAAALSAEQAVAHRNPGTVLYDPLPVLCSAGVCPSTIDGVGAYSDFGHLTRDGSLLLAPSLEDSIARAVELRGRGTG